MAFEEVGASALRAEFIDRAIKGLADPKFVMKQVCLVSESNSWQESYYRESDTELVAASDIGRMASFPQESPIWEKRSAFMKKAGLEVEISHEDVISNNIDVIKRSLMRVSRAVVSSVDTTIWNALSENRTATNIQSVATPADYEWDSTTRANRNPQDQVGDAIQKLAEKNYTADTLILSPKDSMNLLTNDNVMGSFHPNANAVIENGRIGKFLGLNVLVSNAVTADYALVAEAKTCATYRVLESLRTATKYEEGIKHIIRAWETGVPFVTDPKAICLITGTQL